MGSVRTSTALEEKIRQVAARKGITRSEVFRQAVEIYCEMELADPKNSRWDDYIGVVNVPGDFSSHTRELFGEIMDEKVHKSRK